MWMPWQSIFPVPSRNAIKPSRPYLALTFLHIERGAGISVFCCCAIDISGQRPLVCRNEMILNSSLFPLGFFNLLWYHDTEDGSVSYSRFILVYTPSCWQIQALLQRNRCKQQEIVIRKSPQIFNFFIHCIFIFVINIQALDAILSYDANKWQHRIEWQWTIDQCRISPWKIDRNTIISKISISNRRWRTGSFRIAIRSAILRL